MGRIRLEQRIAALAFGFIAWSAAAPVHAEEGSVSATIGAAPHLRECTSGAQNGNPSALADCDLALAQQLGRQARLSALINRGAIHFLRQDYALALADFDAVLQIDPDNTPVLVNRGMTLVALHQPGPAVAALTQALSLGVEHPHRAYYYRGAAREQLGDARGAYEDYSTALEIEPDWAPAEQEMARFARGRRQELASQINDGQAPH